MIGVATGLISMVSSIGGKLIEDKDKKADFAFKILELAEKRMEVLVNKTTYKWVDALVKLAYAGDQIVKGLIRPIGSAAMTGLAIYCGMKGIQLDPAVSAVMVAAFPAWGASRHVDKIKKKNLPDDDNEWGL